MLSARARHGEDFAGSVTELFRGFRGSVGATWVIGEFIGESAARERPTRTLRQMVMSMQPSADLAYRQNAGRLPPVEGDLGKEPAGAAAH